MRKNTSPASPGAEIPPSHRILCIFILRLHDERNTTGIVKSHLTRGGISPERGEICPYKRNTTGICTVGQITIFLDINRIRHKMVKNAIKVGNLRRKTSLGPNFFA